MLAGWKEDREKHKGFRKEGVGVSGGGVECRVA